MSIMCKKKGIRIKEDPITGFLFLSLPLPLPLCLPHVVQCSSSPDLLHLPLIKRMHRGFRGAPSEPLTIPIARKLTDPGPSAGDSMRENGCRVIVASRSG